MHPCNVGGSLWHQHGLGGEAERWKGKGEGRRAWMMVLGGSNADRDHVNGARAKESDEQAQLDDGTGLRL